MNTQMIIIVIVLIIVIVFVGVYLYLNNCDKSTKQSVENFDSHLERVFFRINETDVTINIDFSDKNTVSICDDLGSDEIEKFNYHNDECDPSHKITKFTVDFTNAEQTTVTKPATNEQHIHVRQENPPLPDDLDTLISSYSASPLESLNISTEDNSITFNIEPNNELGYHTFYILYSSSQSGSRSSSASQESSGRESTDQATDKCNLGRVIENYSEFQNLDFTDKNYNNISMSELEGLNLCSGDDNCQSVEVSSGGNRITCLLNMCKNLDFNFSFDDINFDFFDENIYSHIVDCHNMGGTLYTQEDQDGNKIYKCSNQAISNPNFRMNHKIFTDTMLDTSDNNTAKLQLQMPSELKEALLDQLTEVEKITFNDFIDLLKENLNVDGHKIDFDRPYYSTFYIMNVPSQNGNTEKMLYIFNTIDTTFQQQLKFYKALDTDTNTPEIFVENNNSELFVPPLLFNLVEVNDSQNGNGGSGNQQSWTVEELQECVSRIPGRAMADYLTANGLHLSELCTTPQSGSAIAGGRPSNSAMAGGRPSGRAIAGGRPSNSAMAGGRPSGRAIAGGRPSNSAMARGRPSGSAMAGPSTTEQFANYSNILHNNNNNQFSVSKPSNSPLNTGPSGITQDMGAEFNFI